MESLISEEKSSTEQLEKESSRTIENKNISNETNFTYLARLESFQTRDIHVFPFRIFHPISLFIKQNEN
jgi:hypothetical protein